MRANLLIKVPSWWRRECEDWIAAQGLSIEEACPLLATALGRAEPYNYTTVWRYLRGQLSSLEVTAAFARLRGVGSPLVFAEAKELRDWFALGSQLRDEKPDLFDAMLVQAQAVLGAKNSK